MARLTQKKFLQKNCENAKGDSSKLWKVAIVKLPRILLVSAVWIGKDSFRSVILFMEWIGSTKFLSSLTNE